MSMEPLNIQKNLMNKITTNPRYKVSHDMKALSDKLSSQRPSRKAGVS